MPSIDTLPARSNALENLNRRIREGRILALALSYYNHPSRPKLIRILEQAAVPEAAEVLDRLRGCGRYRPCRMYSCPNCGPRIKAREKDQALNRVVRRLGRFPLDTEISFLTLLGPTVQLEAKAARGALGSFWRQVVGFHQRHLPSTSWFGHVDVSLNGILHWHGLVMHSSTPRDTLEDRLKESFREDDQAWVSPWKSFQSLAENMQGVLNYGLIGARHVKIATRRDWPDRQQELVHGPDSLIRIAKRIAVIEALAGRGVQGIRRSINMKPTSDQILVPELETLIRRTKKQINTKSMPNKEWAPRGVFGTHLGGKNPNQV